MSERRPDTANDFSSLDGDFRIGEFLVRPLLKQVVHLDAEGSETAEHNLPDKATGVLVHLAENSRQVCERDQILDAVWGEDRKAYDRVLDNAIAEVRRAFGDDARDPSYIQTVPRRGYRLLRPITPVRTEPLPRTETPAPRSIPTRSMRPEPIESAQPTRRARSTKSWRSVARVALLIVVAGAAAWGYRLLDESSRSDGWRVEIDVAEMESLGAGYDLRTVIGAYLFAEHPCEELNLLRRAGDLESSDFRIRLGVRRDTDGTAEEGEGNPIEAIWTLPDGNDQTVATRVHSGDFIGGMQWVSFLTKISTELDASLCRLEGPSRRSRACHCWASIRGNHLQNEPEPLIERLRLAIELDPSIVVAYEALALIYQSLGSSKEAQSALVSGLERINDPSSARALILRRRLAAILNDPDTELEMIKRLQEIYPDDPRWTLARVAFIARNEQDCKKAAKHFQPIAGQLLNETVTALESSWPLWKCHLREDFGLTPPAAPHESGRRLQLGIGAMMSGRLEEAKERGSELLALQPDLADSYWLLGSIAWRSGDYASASRWFDRMEEHVNWPAERHRLQVGRCRIALLAHRPDDCIRLFSGLEDSNSEIHEWSIRLSWLHGLSLLALDRPDEATQVLERARMNHQALSTRYLEWYLLHLEGRILTAEGAEEDDLRRGVEFMLASAESGPSDLAFFATEAALALERLGEPKQAEEQYVRALEYNPTYPWAHCRLGLHLERIGRIEEAADHMRQAIDIFSNPPQDPLGMECAEALAELDPTFTIAN